MTRASALIVEDSQTMRQLIKVALRRIPGLDFIEVENGVEALEQLKQRPISLVLLDLNMPVMGGHAFLERLREVSEGNAPPVIVITTEGSDEDVRRAMELGATAYVTKPVRAATLAQVASQVLNAHFSADG